MQSKNCEMIPLQVVEQDTSPTGGTAKSGRYEAYDAGNEDDEEYDPTRVRAHIIRGPAAFGTITHRQT